MSEFKFMNVEINYNKVLRKKTLFYEVFFVDEKFNISDLKKHLTNSEYLYTLDLLKTKDLKEKLIIMELLLGVD